MPLLCNESGIVVHLCNIYIRQYFEGSNMAKAKTDMLLDFVYDGVNRRGQKVKGETTSRSLELAKATLRKQGISVKGIKKKPKPLNTFKKSIKPYP